LENHEGEPDDLSCGAWGRIGGDGHEYGMAKIKELPVGDCYFSLCCLRAGIQETGDPDDEKTRDE
jgi:hypothetical protein